MCKRGEQRMKEIVRQGKKPKNTTKKIIAGVMLVLVLCVNISVLMPAVKFDLEKDLEYKLERECEKIFDQSFEIKISEQEEIQENLYKVKFNNEAVSDEEWEAVFRETVSGRAYLQTLTCNNQDVSKGFENDTLESRFVVLAAVWVLFLLVIKFSNLK